MTKILNAIRLGWRIAADVVWDVFILVLYLLLVLLFSLMMIIVFGFKLVSIILIGLWFRITKSNNIIKNYMR
jgi:hypothetical protein